MFLRKSANIAQNLPQRTAAKLADAIAEDQRERGTDRLPGAAFEDAD
jgi:hypothetical protein